MTWRSLNKGIYASFSPCFDKVTSFFGGTFLPFFSSMFHLSLAINPSMPGLQIIVPTYKHMGVNFFHYLFEHRVNIQKI